MVEPVDVGECGEFDVGESFPLPFRVDQFSFVEPVEGLDERVVVAVSLRSDRSNDVVASARRACRNSFRSSVPSLR
jgi:hypothetical protein